MRGRTKGDGEKKASSDKEGKLTRPETGKGLSAVEILDGISSDGQDGRRKGDDHGEVGGTQKTAEQRGMNETKEQRKAL